MLNEILIYVWLAFIAGIIINLIYTYLNPPKTQKEWRRFIGL